MKLRFLHKTWLNLGYISFRNKKHEQFESTVINQTHLVYVASKLFGHALPEGDVERTGDVGVSGVEVGDGGVVLETGLNKKKRFNYLIEHLRPF